MIAEILQGKYTMPMKRKRRQPQKRLLAEYLDSHYAKYPHRQHVRLGQIPPELILPDMSPAEIPLAGQWRKWADGVVIKPKKVIIIEAAIVPKASDISELKMYKSLFKQTPEFRQYRDLPVRMELVYVVNDPIILDIARRQKVRAVHFEPSWMDDHLQTLKPRKRRPPLSSLNGHKER